MLKDDSMSVAVDKWFFIENLEKHDRFMLALFKRFSQSFYLAIEHKKLPELTEIPTRKLNRVTPITTLSTHSNLMTPSSLVDFTDVDLQSPPP